MPVQEIEQLQYPAKSPSENDFIYFVWGTLDEVPWTAQREWTGGAWVLSPLEVVTSFLEIAKEPSPE